MQSNMRGSKLLLIVLVANILLLQLSGVAAIAIEDCGGDGADAKLVHVDIANCGEKDEYCPFIRGTNTSIEVAFTTKPDATFTQAKVYIEGTFAFIRKHITVIPDDACGNYGFDCPVGPNESKTVKLALPVKKIYPSGVKGKVVFKLLDEKKNSIFCITFPAKITSQ